MLDPMRVGGAIDTKHWSSRHRRAAVLDGDWDLARVTRPIIEHTIEQLASGVPPTETDQYHHMYCRDDDHGGIDPHDETVVEQRECKCTHLSNEKEGCGPYRIIEECED